METIGNILLILFCLVVIVFHPFIMTLVDPIYDRWKKKVMFLNDPKNREFLNRLIRDKEFAKKYRRFKGSN